jgi:D-galactonate transporter
MTDSVDEQATYAQVTWRLMPMLFVCYIVAYLDRVNVGFAKLQMVRDLQFSEATYGLGAGIFFVGYCFSELPSNLLLARFGARRWMARIMVTWGIISVCMMFIRTPTSFYSLRFLLGVAEAGMFPGVIFTLTYWYPAHRRGRMMALFMLAQPVSGVIGGPLSGWIMQAFQGVRHMAGWQWLFLLEGLPAVIMGVVLWFRMNDGIEDAAWLNDDQKRMLQGRLDAEAEHKHDVSSVMAVLRDGRVWFLSLITFSSVMGLYGIGFWLPTIIRATGIETPLKIGLLTMIPYCAAMVAMMLVSRSSDRSGERRWHLALSTAVGGVGLLLSTFYGGNTAFSMVWLTVATAGIITSQPLFWNLPTAFLGGTAAAAGIAVINTMGNSAGFVSPYVIGWIVDSTHSTRWAMVVLAGSLFVGSGLTLVVPKGLFRKAG